MQTLVQNGKTIHYQNTSGELIPSGTLVVIGTGGQVGVAQTDIGPNATAALTVVGVHRLAKNPDEAFAQGDTLYYDEGTKALTKVPSTIPVGAAWADAVTVDPLGVVKINAANVVVVGGGD
ncbi:MAG: DUF2190 family protein [Deltaproteobacteria bacterium]|jgi:predicted RecA/RadA family phage recombinase|nr:DUF2190 family protein [Deltaproteobacteria bacterium]